MPPLRFGIAEHGLVRPGVDVRVIDISHGGALVESGAPIRPGSRTELTVEQDDGRRRALAASALRSWISGLSPLRFRAALRFDGQGSG